MNKRNLTQLSGFVTVLMMIIIMVLFFSACNHDGDQGGTLTITITFPSLPVGPDTYPAEAGDVLEVWVWESLEDMEATATGYGYHEDPNQIITVTLTQDHIDNGATVSFELITDICYVGAFVPTKDVHTGNKFDTGDLCEIYNDVDYYQCWENANSITVPGDITIALDNMWQS